MAKRKFTVILIPDEEGYQVVVPHYSGVNTWGETPKEAFANAQEALELLLESEAESERGFTLPPVTPAPHVVLGEIEAEVPECIIEATEEWLSGVSKLHK